jgi:hypothetical protein
LAIYSTGTVSINNGSQTVTGVGTSFLSNGIVAGDLWKIDGESVPYIIAADATSETSLTLLTPYALPNASAKTYQIATDFYTFQIPKIFPSMRDSYYYINDAFSKIADQLSQAGASTYHAQVLTKVYIGVPSQGAFFGYQKFTGAAQLNKIIISSQDDSITDNNLVLDIEINGVLQGLNLTVPAGSSTITSSTLSYIVNAGEIIRYKWITATVPCGSNWNVDLHYQNSSGLIVYYDYQKICIGSLYTNLILGTNYKPANRSKAFAITYELSEAPEGSSIILELLKDGASLGTPVIITIPEGSLTGYLEFSQTEFLTTNTCSLRVNQPGSIVPGQNLMAVLHSYHTTA